LERKWNHSFGNISFSSICFESGKNNTNFVGTAFEHFIQDVQAKYQYKISKIRIFTDGAAAHFKNRYAQTMMFDFQSKLKIPIEWNFFASNHGHGPCDGDGQQVKRVLNKRFRLTKEPIETPPQFQKLIEVELKHNSKVIPIKGQSKEKSKLDGIGKYHKFTYDIENNKILAYEHSMMQCSTHFWSAVDFSTKQFCCKQHLPNEDFIGCDAPNCKFEWFHLRCVGLEEIPEGEWVCNNCKPKPKEKKKFKVKNPRRRKKFRTNNQ